MRRPLTASLVSLALALATSTCGGRGAQLSSAPSGNDAGTLTDASVDTATTAPVESGATSDAASVSLACVPGQSIACTGPGGCATNQVCVADGSGYGPCVCASTDAAVRACVPGASVGCVGPGGCVSNQVCMADGTGYGACACVGDASTLACVPGQSILCGGPGGCTSFQVCTSNGSGYGPCDCPDAGEDASAAWTPAELPGLALWLDDTYGIVMDPSHPGDVLHWLDKSGNGNEATMNGVYGTSGVVPPWYGFSLDAEGVNGFDGVICPTGATPTSISFAESESLDWGSGDFAIAMVVKAISEDAFALWTGNGATLNANDNGQNFALGAFDLATSGTFVTTTAPSTTAFLPIVGRGQALDLTIAGVEATGPVNTTALGGGPVVLCPNDSAEYAEIVAVKGTLADADVVHLDAYFRAKFDL